MPVKAYECTNKQTALTEPQQRGLSSFSSMLLVLMSELAFYTENYKINYTKLSNQSDDIKHGS